MTKDLRHELSELAASERHGHPSRVRDRLLPTELKALQRLKIRKLRDALVNAGLVTLDAQAEALGLRRSTTWAILQANHKASGLSAAIVNRMLESPHLPQTVRATLFEYIEEKSAGYYGASVIQRRRFAARVSPASSENSGRPFTTMDEGQLDGADRPSRRSSRR
jgi:hypothetical protein